MAHRACTALVEPVAVGIEAILDVFLAQPDAIRGSQPAGFVPGLYFFSQQVYVVRVRGMPLEGVGEFVQEAGDTVGRSRIIVNLAVTG